MGFPPFFLAYGAKALLPSDIDHGAPRVKAFDRDRATEAQQDAANLLEEAHEMTIIYFARYQQTLCRYHERKIRGRILEVGDLVLRRTQSTKEKHKLSPPWEGPYTVIEVIRLGTYRLEDNDGNLLNNTWNIEQRRHFPLKFGLTDFLVNTCPCKNTPARTLSARVARGLHKGIILNITSPFYYHTVNRCRPRMEAHSSSFDCPT